MHVHIYLVSKSKSYTLSLSLIIMKKKVNTSTEEYIFFPEPVDMKSKEDRMRKYVRVPRWVMWTFGTIFVLMVVFLAYNVCRAYQEILCNL